MLVRFFVVISVEIVVGMIVSPYPQLPVGHLLSRTTGCHVVATCLGIALGMMMFILVVVVVLRVVAAAFWN